MNFRVILLVILVFIFTVFGVYLSVVSFESNSLITAFNDGNLEITQNTTAGTVPHVVMVVNSGKKPVMVESGQILRSDTSQDLVAAENKMINQNSTDYVKAYCYEPNQTSTPGTQLYPKDKASSDIKQIIDHSNIMDSRNTTSTQLQIWIIVSGNNLDTTAGEAQELVKKQSVSNAEITRELNDARINLLKSLNVTEEEIKNIKPTSSFDIGALIKEFIDWIKKAFNIT
ncbi:MAG TPA: hypothetical protein PLC38_02350 [Methanobacterium sp.]|jgi:hypothetical protein|nr:MAG: hypothetical protein FGO69_05805 [Methanobacterium sp.]HOI71108.1 hypothetical protein [Methanobacterium sp.]